MLSFGRFLPSEILRKAVPSNFVFVLTRQPRGASNLKVSLNYTP